METILKVEYDGDLRRALLNGIPSFAAVDLAVQEIWPGHSVQQTKYEDEEGDFCTLTAVTHPDFLGTMKKSGKNQVLRLRLLGAPAVAVDCTSFSKAVGGRAVEAFSSPWQHVEQGTDDAGSEFLHTVADLTDVQEAAADIAPNPAKSDAVTDAPHGHGCETEYTYFYARGCGALNKEDVESGTSQSTEEGSEEFSTPHNQAEDGMQQHGDQQVDAQAESEQHELLDVSEQMGTVTYAIATPEMRERMPIDGAEPMPAEPMHVAQRPAVVRDHAAAEKIDIIIAAFDETGDAHLNFKEIDALHKAAQGGQLPEEVFRQMCLDWGEDPDVGFGRDMLIMASQGIGSESGLREQALQQHFEAAKLKLQGGGLLTRHGLVHTPCYSAALRDRAFRQDIGSRIYARAQQASCCLGSRLKAFV